MGAYKKDTFLNFIQGNVFWEMEAYRNTFKRIPGNILWKKGAYKSTFKCISGNISLKYVALAVWQKEEDATETSVRMKYWDIFGNTENDFRNKENMQKWKLIECTNNIRISYFQHV